MTRATRPPIAPLGNRPAQPASAQANTVLDTPGEPNFAAIHASPEFRALKRRLRRFVFPMFFLFFSWLMTFVLLAAYAPEFMSRKVLGSINVGLVLGLSEFVTTMVFTVAYGSFMKRNIDPQVAKIRTAAGVGNK